MDTHPAAKSRALLSPEERISEALFGLIMVITFTGSLSVAHAGRDDVRDMLVGALGCNLAWGIIDGVMYLMGAGAESARKLRLVRAARGAADERAAAGIIRSAAPLLGSLLTDDEVGAVHRRLVALPEPPRLARFTRADWLGAAAVFAWVLAVTFPVTLPFMLIEHLAPAMRTSNAVAVGLLAALGFAYGRVVGRNPRLTAMAMVVLGAALVGLTIALGG